MKSGVKKKRKNETESKQRERRGVDNRRAGVNTGGEEKK